MPQNYQINNSTGLPMPDDWPNFAENYRQPPAVLPTQPSFAMQQQFPQAQLPTGPSSGVMAYLRSLFGNQGAGPSGDVTNPGTALTYNNPYGGENVTMAPMSEDFTVTTGGPGTTVRNTGILDRIGGSLGNAVDRYMASINGGRGTGAAWQGPQYNAGLGMGGTSLAGHQRFLNGGNNGSPPPGSMAANSTRNQGWMASVAAHQPTNYRRPDAVGMITDEGQTMPGRSIGRGGMTGGNYQAALADYWAGRPVTGLGGPVRPPVAPTAALPRFSYQPSFMGR